ncbi:Hypothetical predicted protein, partial [Marmota monax]
LPWPRTITDRLLDEMFDSSASRFLAVLEALSDPNRRILQTGPVVSDEVELRDVVSELFIAGKELLIISSIGPSGTIGFPNTPLTELMIERTNVISLDAAVKFIKLAFTYEEWGLFESLAMQLIYFLQDVQPDKEIVVDMIMFLWQKCKLGIQKISMSRNDYTKFTQKLHSNKWFYLLWQINEVIHNYKLEDIDIAVVAEVTLRLSEILEFLGSPRRKFKKYPGVPLKTEIKIFPGTPKGIPEVLPILKKSPVEQLFFAYELLDKVIGVMNFNCVLTTLPSGSPVIDHCYVKEAYSLIEKVEAEQNALYSYQKCLEGLKRKKTRIPPPPLLLSRTHCSVTLKPTPFISDVKIPADGKSIFEVKGLETNEKYVFAVAAYSSNGKLVGDAIGETTKPILVYPPLSAVTARMYLTQVARLTECERILVALELSIFLNDSSYVLQAVTQCYGLLAPIIYHNIVLVPVVQ